MTLGLPPAGIFWQPAEDSPSPNSLPSPLLSFVPRSCSAYLGAVRVREAKREGTGGPASAPSCPPRPPPAPPLLRPSPAPSSWGGRHRALGLHCLTLRLSARCHPSLVGAAEPRNLILPRCCAHAARIPCSAAAAAAATPAGRLGFSFGPFFLRLARVRLVRKLQQMEKGCPLLHPREEKAPLSFLTAAPNSTVPGSSRRRRQLLLIQGAGHRRKSIQDKNQLLPECAAAIDTRARRVAPCSSRGSSSSGGDGGGWVGAVGGGE